MRRYGYMIIYEIDAPSQDAAWEAIAQLKVPHGYGFVLPIPAANIRELEPQEVPAAPTGSE